jgi:hypothetical protein
MRGRGLPGTGRSLITIGDVSAKSNMESELAREPSCRAPCKTTLTPKHARNISLDFRRSLLRGKSAVAKGSFKRPTRTKKPNFPDEEWVKCWLHWNAATECNVMLPLAA